MFGSNPFRSSKQLRSAYVVCPPSTAVVCVSSIFEPSSEQRAAKAKRVIKFKSHDQLLLKISNFNIICHSLNICNCCVNHGQNPPTYSGRLRSLEV